MPWLGDEFGRWCVAWMSARRIRSAASWSIVRRGASAGRGLGASGPYRSMSSAAIWAAWAGPRSARSRPKTSIHWRRASSTDVGDQVGDVVVAAAGHADVGGGGAGVLADQQVRGGDGLALGAVDGAGVGELDVLGDVGRRAACRPPRRRR